MACGQPEFDQVWARYLRGLSTALLLAAGGSQAVYQDVLEDRLRLCHAAILDALSQVEEELAPWFQSGLDALTSLLVLRMDGPMFRVRTPLPSFASPGPAPACATKEDKQAVRETLDFLNSLDTMGAEEPGDLSWHLLSEVWDDLVEFPQVFTKRSKP